MTRAQQLSQRINECATKFSLLKGFRNNYFRNTLNSFLKLNAQFRRKVYKRTISVNARFRACAAKIIWFPNVSII